MSLKSAVRERRVLQRVLWGTKLLLVTWLPSLSTGVRSIPVCLRCVSYGFEKVTLVFVPVHGQVAQSLGVLVAIIQSFGPFDQSCSDSLSAVAPSHVEHQVAASLLLDKEGPAENFAAFGFGDNEPIEKGFGG